MNAQSVPLIPESAPFSPSQRAWLNGFLAGIYSGGSAETPAAPKKSVQVLFGTESGNSEGLARQTAKAARQQGFESGALGLDKVSAATLASMDVALIVTSTFGDGEPPANAQALWAELSAGGAIDLSRLKFAVLALGDRNYEHFCKFGIDLDAKLAALGAKRIHERVDCDADFDAAASLWQQEILQLLSTLETSDPLPTVAANPPSGITTEPAAATSYSRNHPFPARLLTNKRLSAETSAKETRHFEFSLEGSGVTYDVGDALGVLPSNCPLLVDEILSALHCDGEEAVPTPDGQDLPLRTALLRHYEITRIPQALLATVSERSNDENLRTLLDPANQDAFKDYLWGREIIDLLCEFSSVTLTPVDFVACLRKLQPRLYSISSSPKAFVDQVHLTVAAVRYESLGRSRKGVCSTFLADRVSGPVPIFVHVSKAFRLPEDPTTPVIMVGPGTGIAPFRAFLYERQATGASGGNWLFFGDQHKESDFLYREELERFQADGILSRLDTAFSRDQAEKVYVQNRMLEYADLLWKWLEDGAHFYVCGDASRMARDVDDTLHTIITIAGGKSADQAAEYVAALKAARRYQRDVY